MSIQETMILAIVAAGLASSAGCGSSTAVSGSVEYDGRPVANGAITFTPEDGKGPVAGGPIADGRYHLDAITPGRKIVGIVGVKKVNFALSHEEMAQAAKANAQRGDASGIIERADEVPADAQGNNTVVDIVPGVQTRDFKLERPAAKK